jgi:kumamolisin
MIASMMFQGRITTFASSSVTPSGRRVLSGHLAPVLSRYKPLRATAKNSQLQLSISLNLRNRDALTALLAAQNDPTSPMFHHYLTPQEFTDEFGPTQQTVDNVVAYLRGQGINVKSVSANRTLVDAAGSVANVEHAFGVTLQDYSFHGRTVYAPNTDPSLPASIGDAVLNIAGLDNVAQYHHSALAVKEQPHTGPGGGYTPSELRTAYDVNSLISNGDNGSGQTTAIFELDGYTPSDVNQYLSNYGLGSGKYSNVLVDGATNTAGAGAIEVELDMEVVSAIAPGATQKIYIGPNSTTGVNDTYNKIVTDNTAKVTSISWGECESSSGNTELAALDNIFVQGAAQGQAFFAASGDSGAYDCNDGSSTLAVDSPAGDPHVVGVGGTNLSVGSGGTYGSESAWGTGTQGGGGGVSSYFTRPSYQTGTNLTNANRMVPDVSADADPSSGYSVYCTVSAASCSGWLSVGGTSAAAPLWAAVATDTNQYLASQGAATLGSANAAIYKLYNTAQTYPAYHDVTSGNNLYYSATTGYDMATGVGTPDAWNFARDLASSGSGGTPTPTPTPNPTPSPTPNPTPSPTPSPTPNPTPSPTPNPTPSPTPSPTPIPTGTNLLSNPGFESGSTSWKESSSGGYEIVDTSNPHTGSDSAYLCGYNSCSDAIYQTVKIPSSASKITLSYWVYISTNETGSTCYDNFYARLRTSSGTTIATPQKLCNANAQGWTKYTFDVTSSLSSYKGKSVQVYFLGTTDSSQPSSFYVDDVALTAN